MHSSPSFILGFVIVRLNSIESSCGLEGEDAPGCTYRFSQSSTPGVVDVSPLHGSTLDAEAPVIRIVVAGWDGSKSDSEVYFGAHQCDVNFTKRLVLPCPECGKGHCISNVLKADMAELAGGPEESAVACHCDSGWYGQNCDKNCTCVYPGSISCNDGAKGDGTCTCENLHNGTNCELCDTIDKPAAAMDLESARLATIPLAQDSTPFKGSCISRFFLTWVFPLLQRSVQCEKLQASELFDVEPAAMPEVLQPAFQKQWCAQVKGGRRRRGWQLMKVLWNLHVPSLRWLWLLRLVQALLDFSFPLFLNKLVKFVEKDDSTTFEGLLLSLALFSAQALSALVDASASIGLQSCGLRIRSSLIASIFRKVILLRQDSMLSFSSGKLNNMITTDVDKARRALRQIHVLLLTAPLQVAISIVALHSLMGASVFIGLSWMGFVILLNPAMMYIMNRFEDAQQAKTDERVRKATEVISSINVIKCYGWEEPATANVEAARRAELLALWKLYCVFTCFEAIWSSIVPCCTALMFASYSWLYPDKSITAAQAFTAIALLNMVQEPLFTIPWVLNLIVEAYVAAKRIEGLFFLKESQLQGIEGIVSFLPEVEEDTSIDVSNELLDARTAIVFDKASFTWEEGDSDEGAFTLQELMFKVPKGALVGVVGATGAGKSSLLQALLGEMPRKETSGPAQVSRQKPVSFTPQQPWIFNATVRQNILFGEPFSEAHYTECIRCCNLDQDFEQLAAGDQTKVGEKGIALSGGQKARVCLARACYRLHSSSIFLLDDPYSALDAHVAKSVNERAVLGLLGKKTRIVAMNRLVLMRTRAKEPAVCQFTNGSAMKLEFASQCDLLLVLEDGKISSMGSYEELQRSSATLKALLTAQGIGVDSAENADLPQAPILGRAISAQSAGSIDIADRLLMTMHGRAVQSPTGPLDIDEELDHVALGNKCMVSEVQYKILTLRQELQEKKPTRLQESSDEADAEPQEEEERATGQVSREVFFYYLRSMGGCKVVSLLVSLYVGSEILNLLLPIWLAIWTAGVSGTIATHATSHYLSIYVILSVIVVITMTLRDLCGNIYGFRAARNLHAAMFESVLRAPMSFFQDTPQGRIINRFSKDMSEIDKDVIWQMIYTFVPVLGVLGNFAMVGGIAYFALIAFLPAFWLYYLLWKYYNKAVLDVKRISKVQSSPVYDHFNNLCRENAISVVRAFRQAEQQCLTSDAFIVDQQKPDYSQMYLSQWFSLRIDHLGCLLLLFVSLFVTLGRETLIKASAAALVLNFAGECTGSIESLIGQIAEFGMAFNCVERVKFYATQLPQEAARIGETRPPPGWPSQGILQVKNLQVRYKEDLPLVLKGLTFSTNAGERLGVVGRTGAGKSSLLLALLRIVEPELGSDLQLDGQDLLKLGLQDLRRAIAMIPQEPVLFQESLRYNCDPFDEHSSEKIWIALEESQLAPWVRERGEDSACPEEQLEKLLALEIKEGGQNLSVGQRQMVAIARAVLRQSKLVVLDEATAAIDAQTDAQIQLAIRRCFENATSLTIAHRLQTILDCDRIMVLAQGEIVEFAPPGELRAKESGVFRSMLEIAED
eukprot:symbB.v1.2.023547.t1/scaffold2160.1/size87486/2